MIMKDFNNLKEEAIAVLENNWKEGYTIPSALLYPFQWNWDSGFISLGYLHYDQHKAMEEMRTLFRGQWDNGMLPHILFHNEVEEKYFPNADFWGSKLVKGTPSFLKTSGITQPPVHGFVLEEICNQLEDKEVATAFVKELFPKVYHLHNYYYSNRDPHNEGLVYINHPWESGRDNSPLWDEVFRSVVLDDNHIPEYKRVDNKLANPSERPTKKDYDKFIYLVALGKNNDYKDQAIYEQSPFIVQDTLFNALLIKSNESLIRLGERFGYDVQQLKAWQAKSLQRFDEKLWDDELQTYVCYDLKNDCKIKLREVGGFIPIFSGIPNDNKVQQMIDCMYSNSFVGEKGVEFYCCPSFDKSNKSFVSNKYWRGPVWANINWLLYKGLLRYGYLNEANAFRKDTLELVSKLGFYEYFEPSKKQVEDLVQGYGGHTFSWTAAVVLDLINTT